MVESASALDVSVGFFSSAGPRPANEDFAGALIGSELPEPRREIVAVIADGIGGAKGGRTAAETAVRGFLDGFCDMPETMPVQRAAATVVNALNGWLYAQGRRDPDLANMGCTFTALVLRGRIAHVLHIGDTRAYRMNANRLTCLTIDHVRPNGSGRSHILNRALGVEAEMRLDHTSLPMAAHDRFLLCSDGVHGFLSDAAITEILSERSAPTDAARALVAAALDAGSTDNCTALVLDVNRLPAKDSADIGASLLRLPVIPAPIPGQTIDGFRLKAIISDGRFTRLIAALDEVEGGNVALKFPKPQLAEVASHRAAFVREAWVGERVKSPWLVQFIELPPGRQTCLYSVMPLYEGELLETRIARSPAIGLEEGRGITVKLAQVAATLHRAGIIHRDIKPDNVILEGQGSLKLIDLGVVRIPGLEDEPPAEIPGTVAYMAPEMFKGEAGNEATDIYALGVTMFRAFTGAFPYGNADATSPPRRTRPSELGLLRPDLPAWLQATLARAIALDPAKRFRDMVEFAAEMEAGPARTKPPARRERTLYERFPVQFWQTVAALLALALLYMLFKH
jgi:serine/threonine protein phosphatase PrpC